MLSAGNIFHGTSTVNDYHDRHHPHLPPPAPPPPQPLPPMLPARDSMLPSLVPPLVNASPAAATSPAALLVYHCMHEAQHLVVREIVTRQPSVLQHVTADGASLLALAAAAGFIDTVRVLLQAGCDPHLGRPTPLVAAVTNNRVCVVRLLLHDASRDTLAREPGVVLRKGPSGWMFFIDNPRPHSGPADGGSASAWLHAHG